MSRTSEHVSKQSQTGCKTLNFSYSFVVHCNTLVRCAQSGKNTLPLHYGSSTGDSSLLTGLRSSAPILLHKVPTQRGLSGRSSHLLRLLHTQLTAAYGSAFAATTTTTATAAAATHTIKIDLRSQFDLMKQQPINEHFRLVRAASVT